MHATRNVSDPGSYSLDEQYQQLTKLVTKSEVKRFGDLSLGHLPVLSFMGNYTGEIKSNSNMD